MQQPAVIDVATLWEYRQDLAVSKFLSGMHLSLRSQVRGHILGRDNISILTATFSGVMCISAGAVVLLPHLQSVMSSGCGRTRDHGRDFVGGREVVFLMMVDRLLVIRGLSYVSTAEGITTSLRSAGRNLVALN